MTELRVDSSKGKYKISLQGREEKEMRKALENLEKVLFLLLLWSSYGIRRSYSQVIFSSYVYSFKDF